MADGIEWALSEKGRLASLGYSAREKAESDYSYRLSARRYIRLYEEVIEVYREKGRFET